jgi:FixJ family two-component response regulator
MTQAAVEPYRVLVVDDDKGVRDALGNLLESVGLEVQSFGSAEEFVSSCPTTLRSCLILDVQLPQMSGLDLQRQLSKTNNLVPIIFITAHRDDTARERALRGGALGFFNKPFNSEDLLSAIHLALK